MMDAADSSLTWIPFTSKKTIIFPVFAFYTFIGNCNSPVAGLYSQGVCEILDVCDMKGPDRIRGPPRFLSNGYRGLFS
jgi:hypothetical protein